MLVKKPMLLTNKLGTAFTQKRIVLEQKTIIYIYIYIYIYTKKLYIYIYTKNIYIYIYTKKLYIYI